MTDTMRLRAARIATGGARGIGAAISEKLVAEGAKVIVADSGVDISGNDPDHPSQRHSPAAGRERRCLYR